MNKPTANIALILLILCFVVGCSKKDHTNAPPGQPGIANLVKQTVIVYHRSGLDFSTYSDYIYDGQDRVTSFRQYQTNVGINEVDTFHSFIFQYANNETLPSGSQEKFMNDWSEYDVVTHQYEYDNQNRLVFDTLTGFSNGQNPGLTVSRRIEYKTGEILVHNINLIRNNGVKERFNDTVRTDANGNALATATLFGTTFLASNTPSVLGVGFTHQTYAYTNLINSFNKLNVKNVLAFVQTAFRGGDFYGTYLGENLAANSTFIAPPFPDPFPTSYAYTTNPARDNRVEKVAITYVDGTGDETISYK